MTFYSSYLMHTNIHRSLVKYLIIALSLILVSLPTKGQKQPDEPTSYLDDLSFAWSKKEDTIALVVKNKLLTPIQVYLYSRADSANSKSFLVLPKDSTEVARFISQLPDSVLLAKFNDSTKIGYFWGHSSLIKPDTSYLYRFPFKKGKKYEVSQSFNGKASHRSIRSKYAIDFQLNVGEPVYAAREGIVVKVIDWFTKQGGKELVKAANRIIILHSDGTMANYAHLQYQGSLVKEGQQVERGQKIGFAGVTGYSRGPHLHFVVRKENDISIPIFFEGHEGVILKKGRRYKVVE
ncbi:M23 family metallopeptidase [Fulvivirga sp. RKSG066]|uniref:M23 family metallopeptidase n=1 Tax=Fulvivirga aurantia TaxID=2529383 RepID=UPI0012BD1DD8|nr:M23 family metallopeptidase [Fulvivirga aurantia]MTI23274.1 M23 family metallopeptidase [Fulvivirga aurantia]